MCNSFFFYYFFFSSRRRHPRCSRDWSSDVCSSDLLLPERKLSPITSTCWKASSSKPRVNNLCGLNKSADARSYALCQKVIYENPSGRTSRRSEERRVGKECRSRW